jgi:hypothetical protein
MDIIANLQSTGLLDDEAAAYLALLELDGASVAQIALASGLKRPTCYVVLGSLEAKGLAHRVPGRKGLSFRAAPPETLVQHATERLTTAKLLVPLLAARAGSDSLSPRVSLYEGASGQRRLFGEMLTHLKVQRSPEICWLSDWEALEKRRPGELERSFAVHSAKRVAKREIILDSPRSRELAERYEYPEFSARFVPASQGIAVDLGISGNRAALFSLEAPLFGLLIEHDAVARSLLALFELAWVAIAEA